MHHHFEVKQPTIVELAMVMDNFYPMIPMRNENQPSMIGTVDTDVSLRRRWFTSAMTDEYNSYK